VQARHGPGYWLAGASVGEGKGKAQPPSQGGDALPEPAIDLMDWLTVPGRKERMFPTKYRHVTAKGSRNYELFGKLVAMMEARQQAPNKASTKAARARVDRLHQLSVHGGPSSKASDDNSERSN
jgi:hypothetical protein